MSDCFSAQVIQRATLIGLDDCGRIPATGLTAIKGLEDGLITVGRTHNVTQATDNTVKTVNGKSCTKQRGCPTDSGYTYTLTFCGNNIAAQALAGLVKLDLDAGGNVIGYEDTKFSCPLPMALEIIFKPLAATSCAAGATAQCRAMIVPYLTSWATSGDETYNADTTPDLVMTGETVVSKNLFANFANAAALPAFLSHWGPKFADIGTGRAWSYNRMVTCPAASNGDPCAIVAL